MVRFILPWGCFLFLCRCCFQSTINTTPCPCSSREILMFDFHCCYRRRRGYRRPRQKPNSLRATLLYNNLLFIAGGALCAVAVGSSGLFFGRFLGGIAVGCVRDHRETSTNFPLASCSSNLCSSFNESACRQQDRAGPPTPRQQRERVCVCVILCCTTYIPMFAYCCHGRWSTPSNIGKAEGPSLRRSATVGLRASV